MTVASLTQHRKSKGDSGRCTECGELRIVCRFRGGHEKPCEHPPDRILRRTYIPRYLSTPVETTPRCMDCGENLYPPMTARELRDF